ncbi:MAG: hypothetical protein PHI34_00670 [Acidobacteriota bacterium]|nr:hypothetical protein [Acidobacteriota bacterium]
MKIRILRVALLSFLIPSSVLGRQPGAAVPDANPKPAQAIIRLERVPDFGQGMDWGSLFRDYQSRGSYRNLVRLPDGRLLVTDTRTYNILIFDARGRFVKKLWTKGRREASSLTVYNRPEWLSLWNDRLLFVSELGRVRVFNLNGHQVREAVIDHPVNCLVPLNETTVAVAGWVERMDAPILNVIALVDLATGRETVLRDMPEDAPQPFRTKDGKTVSAQATYARIRPFVRALGSNEFAAGFSNWPEVEVFDASGRSLRFFRLRGEPSPGYVSSSLPRTTITTSKKIPPSSADEPARDAAKAATPKKRIVTLESLFNYNAGDSSLKVFGGYGIYYDAMKSAGALPRDAGANPYETPQPGHFVSVPYNPDPGVRYFNFVIDKQGRFLVFSFPESGYDPVVRILSPAGDLVREARIETGDYRISFSPGEAGPIFDGEYLITLAEEKAAGGVPLRLLKFRIIGL